MNWKKGLREISRVNMLGEPYYIIGFSTQYEVIEVGFYTNLSFETPLGVICFGEDLKRYIENLNEEGVPYTSFVTEYLKYYNELLQDEKYGVLNQKELF